VAKETKPLASRAETLDRLEIRIGRLIEVVPEPSAPKLSYRMTIDFGDRQKQSVGRFTKHPITDLAGRLVVGVLNFGPVTIGGQISDVLVLGVQYPKADSGEATFLTPAEDEVAVASRVGYGSGASAPLPIVEKSDTFDPLEIRLGRVMEAVPIVDSADSSCCLTLDFGKFGRRQSVVPFGHRQAAADLKGRLLLGVLNFEPETFGETRSEVHLLGVEAAGTATTFLTPAKDNAKIGGKLF